MASSFFGIEIAKTGLFISQKHLNLTGHNIANANTEGYTRQRIVSESIDPHGIEVRWALMDTGRVGGGVRVQSLERIRDNFLDIELRRENAGYGKLNVMEENLFYIQSIFDEASNSTLSNALADFFNSFQELSKNTTSEALRTDVKTKAQTFIETIHLTYSKLEELQRSMDDSIEQTANRVNELLESIENYNRQIYRYEITGEKANDLRDKRDLMIDELSTLLDIQYSETGNKLTISTTGGQVLLDHTDRSVLSVIDDTANNNLNKVRITDPGGTTTDLVYTGGEMEGFRTIRDGDTSNNYGLPYLMEQINTLVEGLVNGINGIHSQGWTLLESPLGSVDGIDFFTIDTTLPSAKGLSLSADILDSVWNIACSDEEITALNVESQRGNNKNLLDLLTLISNETLTALNGTSYEGYLKNVVTEIGSQTAKVQTLNAAQLSVVLNLEERRMSVSSVSIDEEVTLMMQFQHMYAANSRMLTALDEALDVLINRTGLVGR